MNQYSKEKEKSFFLSSTKIFFTFIHSFISSFLAGEMKSQKIFFSFFFSMGWNQSLLLESSSSSHPIDPNFRNEKLKSKDPKKMSETLATKVFFLSLRLIFLSLRPFFKSPATTGKKVSCFFGCHNLHQMSFRNDKNVFSFRSREIL